MPVIKNKLDITLVAGGGTTNLPVSGLYDIYRITSAASVTLLANVVIQASGTPISGHFFDFEWTPDLTLDGNTVTVFGATLPEDMANKEGRITAYYNGSAWEVKFMPDFSEDGVIPTTALSNNPFILVSSNDTLSFDSDAISTEEVAYTFTIPANTLQTSNDVLIIEVQGSTAANANAKAIKLTSNGQTFFENTTTASPNAQTFILRYVFTCNIDTGTGGGYGVLNFMSAAGVVVANYYRKNPANLFNWATSEDITLTTTTTGTAADVSINSVLCYKITA